jgi:hypothetical protein
MHFVCEMSQYSSLIMVQIGTEICSKPLNTQLRYMENSNVYLLMVYLIV